VGLRQLHPALLVHTTWLAGRRRLVAQASAGRPPLILNSPLALSALGALPDAFDRGSAGAAWRDAGIPQEGHDELWAGFDSAGLFAKLSENGTSWWDELGWQEARTYHEATRDYPFLQMDQRDGFAQDAERMDEYRGEAPAPSVYQHLGHDAIGLARPGRDESHDEWLKRMPAGDRRGREGVGLLLDVCFGERGQIKVAGQGRCLLKSIPSVRGGQYRDAVAQATLDLFTKHQTPPSAVLVFTSRVERSMWRYRDPRSFRAILVDVGHAVMAYRYVARELGFRTYAYQKMRDRQVAELVGVDRVVQPPLYVGSLVP